jgi:hypothetical protein
MAQKKTMKAQPVEVLPLAAGVVNALSASSLEDVAAFAVATGQTDKLGQEFLDAMPAPAMPAPVTILGESPKPLPEPDNDDVLIVEVRDIHGALLFKYNDRTGCIEILQRSKPDGKGGKFPAMLYNIPVQEMMALGRHNLFATHPTKVLPVSGVVASESE